MLLSVQLLGALWLGLTWITYAPDLRWGRVAAIARAEHILQPIPRSLLEQAEWLVRARLARLKGLSVLCGLAGVIGLVEGWERRRQDVRAGFRFSWWTVGTTLVMLLPGILGGALLLPVPVTLWTLTSIGAGVVGVITLALTRGRPYVA